MAELLLGCGRNHARKIAVGGRAEWSALTTLDINDDVGADVIHDIAKLPLPFPDNAFDEVHAYEVMEHVGQQGDWRFFFAQWSDLWRILKPGGLFVGTSPAPDSQWAWGDPGHTRIVGPECMTFLSQRAYTDQVGVTPMTDYRFVYRADFEPRLLQKQGTQFIYILEAIKPSRISI